MTTVLITRPMRNLLAGSPDGIAGACAALWEHAAASSGRWSPVEMRAALGFEADPKLRALSVRARGAELDVRMEIEDMLAIGTGRRLIVVVPRAPDTLTNAAIGRPLSEIWSLPYMRDPAIKVLRVIASNTSASADVRCRCPSHAIELP